MTKSDEDNILLLGVVGPLPTVFVFGVATAAEGPPTNLEDTTLPLRGIFFFFFFF